MKRILWLAIGIFIAPAAAPAAETLRKFSWAEVQLPAGVELTPEGDVHVRSASSTGTTILLLEISSPGITKSRYSLEGRVRYEGVEGEGYLEVWNVFSAEEQYFTRTLGDAGPLKSLSGSSAWRDLALPFDASGTDKNPEKLIVNIVLPQRGDVWLTPLTLIQFEDDEWPVGPTGGGGSAVGFWGGIGGALLGIGGALLGWLGGRGKAKGFVLSGLKLMILSGAIALVLGIVALARGASSEVAYTLFLLGTIAVLAPWSALTTLKKRYEEAELRRMHALDA